MSSTKNNWFIQVPLDLFRDELMKPTTIKIYGVIKSFRNNKTHVCCPTVAQVAATMNCSERTVRDAIKVLVAQGYIKKHRHFFKFLK
jgi:DNA-binding MarR family transcriptional regulator